MRLLRLRDSTEKAEVAGFPIHLHFTLIILRVDLTDDQGGPFETGHRCDVRVASEMLSTLGHNLLCNTRTFMKYHAPGHKAVRTQLQEID